jgi:hypothetical protein
VDTSVLNVVVGLILIFLLYSLLATAIQESLSALIQRRANTLYRGIKTMLTNTEPQKGMLVEFVIFLIESYGRLWYWVLHWFLDKDEEKHTLYEKFYDHPIIKNYSENIVFNKPSYLTSENFSTIIIDIIKNLNPHNLYATATFKMILDNVNNYSYLPDKDQSTDDLVIEYETYKILNYHLNEAAGDLDVFKYRMERWFNDTMDRVSGWYKRSTQMWLFILGVVLSIAFNLDTIEIANYLSRNKEAAEKLADMGAAIASNPQYSGKEAITQEVYDSLKQNFNKVNTLVGLGWGDYGLTNENFKNRILASDKELNEKYLSYQNSATIRFKEIEDSLSQIPPNDIIEYTKAQDKLVKLRKNKDRIIKNIQFSFLYDNEGASLKRKYIFYNLQHYPKKWTGFFIAAIAISLGAPFWFDLLNKFVSLRTAVKTVDSSGSTTKNNKVDDNEIDG